MDTHAEWATMLVRGLRSGWTRSWRSGSRMAGTARCSRCADRCRWAPSRRSGPTVGKVLINRGCAVVDLTNLQLKWEPGVAVFATLLEHAGGWPDARMVLFAADGELGAALKRSQVARTVPLAADLLTALGLAEK